MARTQQTARKSTGGMAPRRKLILKDNNDSESRVAVMMNPVIRMLMHGGKATSL